MAGIDMLMKSMGMDPAEIKKSIGEFGQLVVTFNQKLDEVQKQNNEILEILRAAKSAADESKTPIASNEEN